MTVPPLDPELAYLGELDVGFGGATFDVAGIRSALDEFVEAPTPTAAVAADGFTIRHNPELVVEAFVPTTAGPHPCLIWFHGGGYLIGSAAMDAPRLQRWAARFGCVTISVEYRLAPENPYPAAHDDAMAALQWVRKPDAALDVDPDRIVVAGASAGGGLAAAAVLAAGDHGIPLLGQLLFYPMLDDRQQTTSSKWAAAIWPPEANQFAWRSYLGVLYRGEVPAYAATSRRTHFDGLPPTLVVVGGADGFVDEDLDYAARLTRAGVPTDLRVYAGAPHGFDLMAPEARVTKTVVRDVEDWLGILLDQDQDQS